MKKKISGALRIIIIGILALMFAYPVIMTAARSFIYDGKLSLTSYWRLFVFNFTYLDYFWNSVIYATLITVVCIIISFPLGFLFAKIKFKGRELIFFIYILVMMLPFQATSLPNYIQLRDFGMLNTRLALTVPMMFSPFAVFLFRQYMKNIPNDLLDSTLLESSSIFSIFRYAVIPQVKPAIAALSILIFCESWNIVEQALIFSMDNTDIYPLSVMLSNIPADVSYAGGTIYMFPVLALFVLFREALESSMEEYKL